MTDDLARLIKFRDDSDAHQLLDFMRATEIRINVVCGLGPHLRLVPATHVKGKADE